ncbi:holo-ACP synthase [Candidatus Fermentibacterales bacterium]|nr:holo-ACP synthase [Candidatus Fermentibacterales bacterium]
MSAAAGIDIIENDRFDSTAERLGPGLLERLFTETERQWAAGLPASRLAANFAAKEAFLKALGTGLSNGMRWREIELVEQQHGPPSLRVSGRAAELLAGRRVSVSVSRTSDLSVALVTIGSPGGES